MGIFSFPSRFEDFEIVLIEAQAAGLKCLTGSEIPKIAKITSNLLFLPLNEELWADKMFLYSKGYQREDMTDILERAEYRMKALAAKFEKIYAALPDIGKGRVKRSKITSYRRIGVCV